ncbi:unnamed protein product [Vitrella brassicaformis CCMP3155]|uniref:Uncharacterized protein n=1 Tax=Vitrella brassicaformis (strain CCMP3155) TaxID=1169540 RepID=A0A0G4FQN6_VITBC|nr:unnamed protein product [Vitrella brassicaformis CCMP3155]|eukprot:CEM16759.1 unnamed protein product [Vitrella brassicaformis CCMP3155]
MAVVWVAVITGGMCPCLCAASSLTGSPSHPNASSFRRALRSPSVNEQQYDANDRSLPGRSLLYGGSSSGDLNHRQYQFVRIYANERTDGVENGSVASERLDKSSAPIDGTGEGTADTTILAVGVCSAVVFVGFFVFSCWLSTKSRHDANAHRDRRQQPAAAPVTEPPAAPASPVGSQPERWPSQLWAVCAFSRQGSLVRSLSAATGEPEHEPARDVASAAGSRPQTPQGNAAPNALNV